MTKLVERCTRAVSESEGDGEGTRGRGRFPSCRKGPTARPRGPEPRRIRARSPMGRVLGLVAKTAKLKRKHNRNPGFIVPRCTPLARTTIGSVGDPAHTHTHAISPHLIHETHRQNHTGISYRVSGAHYVSQPRAAHASPEGMHCGLETSEGSIRGASHGTTRTSCRVAYRWAASPPRRSRRTQLHLIQRDVLHGHRSLELGKLPLLLGHHLGHRLRAGIG